MKNLIPIIGKSPSEKLFEDFMRDLEVERTRVRDAISAFAATPKKVPKAKSKVAQQKQMMLKLGIDQSDIDKFLEGKKDD
jgi:predicted Zn-dependent protease